MNKSKSKTKILEINLVNGLIALVFGRILDMN